MIESCKSHARAMQESFTILETNTQESNPNTTLTTQKLMTKKQQRMAERYWNVTTTHPQLQQQLQVQLPVQPNIIEKYHCK